MKQKRAYQYRFYPTSEQEHLLARTFGCARYIYNWALRLRTDAYYKNQQRIGYHETSAQLTLLKKQTPWLVEYKATWYGRRLIKIDKFYPSSKRCSHCGHVLESLALDVREWTCPECSAHHDRDINAAKNVLAAGLAVAACGESVRPGRVQVQPGMTRRSRKASR